MSQEKTHITVVVLGHSGSGKSTLIGHLLYKSGEIDKETIDQLDEKANEMGKGSLKYAWVLDKLEAERERGMTIDISLCKFETTKHRVTIIDAPGHRDYVENTITGITQADCALLVVSATDGEFEAGMDEDGLTRDHCQLAYTLGIEQMIVAVNKMDNAGPPYSRDRYDYIQQETFKFLKKVGFNMHNVPFIPVSGWLGDNLIESGEPMVWYEGWSVEGSGGNATGTTLLDAFDALVSPKRFPDKPLRLPIQHVDEVPGIGTVPVGRIETGVLKPNMTINFAPVNLQAEVQSIEMHHKPLEEAGSGDIVEFNVDVKDLRRGYVASDVDNDPAEEAVSFVAQFHMLNHPAEVCVGYTAILDCHTAHIACTFAELKEKIDFRTGKTIEDNPERLTIRDAGIVTIIPSEPICVEKYADYPTLGRFVIREMNKIVGAGKIIEVQKKSETSDNGNE